MNTVKHKKGVMKILQAMSIDMGGFPVKQALPLEDVQMVDPFLLLHHANVRFDSNQKALHQGVGPHPHRYRGLISIISLINGSMRKITRRMLMIGARKKQKGNMFWILQLHKIRHFQYLKCPLMYS